MRWSSGKITGIIHVNFYSQEVRMQKYQVFVTRQIPQSGLDILQPHCHVDVWPENLPPTRQQMLESVSGIQGLLSLLTDLVDDAVMQAAGDQLRVISNYAVGLDNIDLMSATRRGIAVGHTPDVLTEACADLTFALLLAAARRILEGDRQVRAGDWLSWQPMDLLGMDVHGRTLGLVGFGRIGQAVAKRAKGFDMSVLFYDPHYNGIQNMNNAISVGFDELLTQSDFVSLHAPLTPQTYHLIDKQAIARMIPEAILINTARGGLVDQEALYSALASGCLAAAALDVTDPEPIPTDHPLLKLPNLLVTPHIASASHTARNHMAVMAAENLLAGLRGERLPHSANPEVYN